MPTRVNIPVLVILVMGISLCSGTAMRAAEIPRKLKQEEAVYLVSLGYGLRDERWLEPEPYMSKPFFVFDGINRPPRNGSFGFFAVNPWTGDVWALWGCHRLSAPALRRAQAEIRHRFTAGELKHYDRLRRRKPFCIVED